jgi:hypothetical protein
LGGVLRTTLKHLLQIKGLSEAKVDKILTVVKKLDTVTKGQSRRMNSKISFLKLIANFFRQLDLKLEKKCWECVNVF